MREIKFRGKRIDNGEWVCGKFLKLVMPDEHFILPIGSDVFPELFSDNDEKTGRYFVKAVKVIPETVGQYTGMKDKNGTKIFEGDICEFRLFNCRRVGVVLFSEEKYRYELLQSGDIDWSLEIHEAFDLEVIGNIHNQEDIANEEAEN